MQKIESKCDSARSGVDHILKISWKSDSVFTSLLSIFSCHASCHCLTHKCQISILDFALIFILHTGCEVAPDVNVAAQKFLIRLLIPAPEGMNEVYLRCENVRPHTHTSLCDILSFLPPPILTLTISPLGPPPHRPLALSFCSASLSLALQEQQYAQWMAACRLGSKGKSLADSSFESEIQSIRSFLAMQKTSSGSHGNAPANDESINTHSLVSPRYHKKYKTKQVQGRWNLYTTENKCSKCDVSYFQELQQSSGLLDHTNLSCIDPVYCARHLAMGQITS